MRYIKSVTLKDGTTAVIRNLEKKDAAAAILVMHKTAGETEFLTRRPQECAMTLTQEEAFIEKANETPRELLIGAFVGAEMAGMASLSLISARERVSHRAVAGIALTEKFWNRGIGKAMMLALIESAGAAGYEQIELDVVDKNERAAALYQILGFQCVGRIPRALRYDAHRYADLLRMVLFL